MKGGTLRDLHGALGDAFSDPTPVNHPGRLTLEQRVDRIDLRVRRLTRLVLVSLAVGAASPHISTAALSSLVAFLGGW